MKLILIPISFAFLRSSSDSVKLEGEKVSDRALKVKAGTYTVQVGKRRWARITVVVK